MATDSNTTTEDEDEPTVSRRDFTKAVGALGGLSASTYSLSALDDFGSLWPYGSTGHGVGTEYGEYGGEDVVHTTCGLCHANCPVQMRIDDADPSGDATGYVRKIAGNPYAFQMTYPHAQVPYASDPDEVAMGDLEGTGDVATDAWSLSGGRICLKGQSGMQIAFDEYRVRQPLKRVGDRGDDQWETIPWEQAIEEIVHGDDELGHPGLAELDVEEWYSEEEVMSDWEAVQDGEMERAEFDDRYGEFLIDTDHPDLGPKTNQLVDMGGYRRQFIRPRFWQQGLGSINSYHHAGVCGITCLTASHACHAGGKGKGYQHPDLRNCEYFIAWGSNPLVATKGPVWTAAQISVRQQEGMRMDVVDPRLSKTAEKAEKWVPVKPGADAALAFGMARWIIEHERYDETFLTNPCRGAALQDDEPNWCDASHLVLVDREDQPKARPDDLGIDVEAEGDVFVAVDRETGEARATSQPFDAELFVDREIGGERVRSVFELYRERVFENTIEEYAEMAGVQVDDIVEMADEFTSHGKRVAIQTYRGPAQHPHGFYNVRAVVTLQHLIGNYDHKGGQVTTNDANYATTDGRYDLESVPEEHETEAREPWGIPITRGPVRYEGTSLYEEKVENGESPYPAERPWFATSVQMNQEVWPSAKDEYPYGIDAMFIRAYGANNVTSAAGGDRIPEIMADEDTIDLIVACDTVIGETSRYADYILPEPTYLERWENFDANQNELFKSAKLTRPVVQAFGSPDPFDGPTPFEDVLIEMWKEMDLPGVGEDAFADAEGNTYPLHRGSDFWVKLAANVAYDDDPVPDADDEELAMFRSSVAKGLGDPGLVDRWQEAVADEDWRKAVTVLNRGGRFEPPVENFEEKFEQRGYKYRYAARDPDSNAYDGEHTAYQLATRAEFYDESLPQRFHSYTGDRLDPLPDVKDGEHYDGTTQLPVKSDAEPDRPLQLINWKHTAMGIQRTMGSSWLREVQAENPLWINTVDAEERGIENGDAIEIDAGRATLTGTARVTEGIRPGVVGAAFAYGRETNGAVGTEIDSAREEPSEGFGHFEHDPFVPAWDTEGYANGQGEGFCVNHLMELDEALGDTGISDVVGGSHAQYDTFVEVQKQ